MHYAAVTAEETTEWQVKPSTEGGLCQNQDEEASDVSLNNDDSGDNLSDTTTP